MEVRFFSTIWQVKKYWLQIIKNESELIYQTYSFNKLCYLYRITSISNIKSRNTKCCFAVLFRGNIPVCIAPLIIEKSPEYLVCLLGTGTNAGYLDFIYNTKTAKEEIISLFQACKTKYSTAVFKFIFVKNESPLVDEMKHQNEFNNYAIHVSKYETYFSGLSKSTRQNIRTAYNRIRTDGLNYELKRYDKNSLQLNKIISILNIIYQKRRMIWMKCSKMPSTRTMVKIQKRDIVYQTMRELPQSVIYTLRINHKDAAFLMGYEYKSRIYVPRLAIDDIFDKYSPGFILINECLKYLAKENFIFDLGKGDESYKSKLGGSITTTYLLYDKALSNS